MVKGLAAAAKQKTVKLKYPNSNKCLNFQKFPVNVLQRNNVILQIFPKLLQSNTFDKVTGPEVLQRKTVILCIFPKLLQ